MTDRIGWNAAQPKRSSFNGKALLIIGAALLVAYLVFNQQTPTATNGDYQEQYGGSASVYAQIATDTNCDSLQETFDRAAANNDAAEPGTDRWTIGYMVAAEDRMQVIGC